MNEFLTSRELVNRETVHRLVDELFDLQDRTDPRACVAPEAIEFRGDVIGKDAAAERAAGIASLIFFRPCGMGREPSSGSSRVHQFGAASAVGRPYSRDSWRGIALFSRPCGPRGGNHVPRLAALIFGAVFNVGAGRWFFFQAVDCLLALDHGEAAALFLPARNAQHGHPYSLARLKLWAVAIGE
jgi:hypothetical protein